MIVLGIDPGQTIGWARLSIVRDPVRGDSATYRAAGDFRADAVDVFVTKLFEEVDVVALEDVQGFPYGQANFKRAKALLDAGKIGERIATIAAMKFGKRVERMTALKARGIILGKRSANDQMVKPAIQRLVRQWPTRTNAHERDAALVALAVGLTMPVMRRTGT